MGLFQGSSYVPTGTLEKLYTGCTRKPHFPLYEKGSGWEIEWSRNGAILRLPVSAYLSTPGYLFRAVEHPIDGYFTAVEDNRTVRKLEEMTAVVNQLEELYAGLNKKQVSTLMVVPEILAQLVITGKVTLEHLQASRHVTKWNWMLCPVEFEKNTISLLTVSQQYFNMRHGKWARRAIFLNEKEQPLFNIETKGCF